MINEAINYSALVDQAMHWVVRQSLGQVKNGRLPGDHHFYITFFTRFEDVVLSPRLLAKYPIEMTVVLQHQFENFAVDEDKFSVTLTFDGVRERIEIPYKSLIAFVDPSVKFALQFQHEILDEEKTGSKKQKPQALPDNVISLDQFRKKRK